MDEWPELRALRILVAVADYGSLSAGARAIGMAQPNASRSVARLERSLGLTLIVRSTSGSRLTPSGLLVVEWARDVLTAARTLVEGAGGLADSGGGGLAVSASQTVAEHLLPRWLAELRSRHSGASVDVRVENSAQVVGDLLAGTCDLGFVEGPRSPRGTHSCVVAVDELVVVTGPDHPWARRRRGVTREELAGTALITREPGSGTRISLDTALGRPVSVLQEFSSNAAVRVAVQSGAGAAVLSRLAVTEGLGSGRLCEIEANLDLHRPLRAVWTGPRRLTGLARDLVQIASTSRPAS